MWDLLRLTPGSVSPFGLLSDKAHRVTVVLEKLITEAAAEELVNFHPNRNTATLSLQKRDFLKFLEYIGTEVIFLKNKKRVHDGIGDSHALFFLFTSWYRFS